MKTNCNRFSKSISSISRDSPEIGGAMVWAKALGVAFFEHVSNCVPTDTEHSRNRSLCETFAKSGFDAGFFTGYYGSFNIPTVLGRGVKIFWQALERSF